MFEPQNSNCFSIKGEINFANVVKIEHQGHALIKTTPQKVIFDLQHVTIDDNAVMALLTSWVRYAKHTNKIIGFANLPKQILDMAKVSDLAEILPIID